MAEGIPDQEQEHQTRQIGGTRVSRSGAGRFRARMDEAGTKRVKTSRVKTIQARQKTELEKCPVWLI